MAKTDKAIPEEIPIEEAPAIIQELVAAQIEEPPEQREERLKREDYARRNLEAMAEYEEILSRNGVSNPVHPSRNDSDAAVNQRCCF